MIHQLLMFRLLCLYLALGRMVRSILRKFSKWLWNIYVVKMNWRKIVKWNKNKSKSNWMNRNNLKICTKTKITHLTLRSIKFRDSHSVQMQTNSPNSIIIISLQNSPIQRINSFPSKIPRHYIKAHHFKI